MKSISDLPQFGRTLPKSENPFSHILGVDSICHSNPQFVTFRVNVINHQRVILTVNNVFLRSLAKVPRPDINLLIQVLQIVLRKRSIQISELS